MATSVPEQIAVKVKTRLGLISTESGYETTVASVKRPKRISGGNPKIYDIRLNQSTLEANDELNHPGNPPAQGWDLSFDIAGILRQSEEATESVDTIRNQFDADVLKSLGTVTSGDWRQWDGLAINTQIGSVEPFQSESESGFTRKLVVQFRTDETNLYNVRA